MKNPLFLAVPLMGAIGLFYTFLKFNWVSKQDAGDSKMKEISTYIAEGAMAFLRAEWKILSYFVIIVSILLGIMALSNPASHWSIAIAFIIGAVSSALAGFIGMRVATKANVRTAQAAKTSLSKALSVSFGGGSVMGLGVAGLAVLGLGSLYIVLHHFFAPGAEANSEAMVRTIEVLTGFSLGAESIALFARVGGGIYTKAADVGADLVGKVEKDIPEDDPRNPATIADNVGDNVGDVAGMGADLFGSYVATVLATMVLGQEAVSHDNFGGYAPILSAHDHCRCGYFVFNYRNSVCKNQRHGRHRHISCSACLKHGQLGFYYFNCHRFCRSGILYFTRFSHLSAKRLYKK